MGMETPHRPRNPSIERFRLIQGRVLSEQRGMGVRVLAESVVRGTFGRVRIHIGRLVL